MKKLSIAVVIAVVIALALALTATRAAEDAKAKAKANYAQHCKGCHGADGKGNTILGQKLDTRDYTDPKVQATLKDEAMFKAIKEGLKKGEKTLMKPYSDKLNDAEIKALAALFREFKK